MNGAYLGPEFSNDIIKNFLDEKGYKHIRLSDEELSGKIADLINKQNVIGWFQGRMEFGPRALEEGQLLETRAHLRLKRQ